MNKKNQLLDNNEIAAFCDQLSMVVSAGIPIYDGLSVLIEGCEDDNTKDVLMSIFSPLEEGNTFHQAMTQSGHFPKYVLDMIEIGELSGNLDDVLSSLAHYYEREENIRLSIRNAVTYPLLMIVMMFAVILVLIAKVLPIFNQIYQELGSTMTGFAAVMLSLSTAINKYIFVILFVIALIIILFVVLSKLGISQSFYKKSSLSMATASSRFANCMHLALSSGLDTDQGLSLAAELADNPYIKERIETCRQYITDGSAFADAIKKSQVFAPIYGSLITIGFKTGSIDSVMKKISEEYENDIDFRIGKLITILEPTLVIIMSVLIGLILLSFLMPLIGIMASIG